MKTLPVSFVAALALGGASCASSGGSWHYKSYDKALTHGRAGQDLSIQSEGITVQFRVPAKWKIMDSLEEPLDWDFAANAPHDERQFGVVVVRDSGLSRTEKARCQTYLDGVHEHNDPKVRMTPEAPFKLKDGSSITPYRFFSEYWKQRLVIIIPEGKAMTIFEFTAPTQESLRSSRDLIQQMLGTYFKKA